MKTKKIYFNLLIVFFLFAASAYSQSSLSGQQPAAQSNPTIIPPSSNEVLTVPSTMNYQAVARNGAGAILATTTVGLRLTVEDGPGGSPLYSERQTPTTNQFGLLTVKLGSGTVLSGTWAGIVWSNGGQWLKVDMDPTGGSSYTPMGESELLSVPFANFSAATAAVSGTTNNLSKFTSPNTIGNARITDDGSVYMNFGTATNWLAYNFDAANYCNMRVHNNVGGAGEAYFVADRLGSTDNGGLAIGSGGSVQWAVGSFANDNLTISNWNLAADAITVLGANNYVGIGNTAPTFPVHITTSTYPGIQIDGSDATWSGMYANATNASAYPFYGYKVAGGIVAWTTADANSNWYLANNGYHVAVLGTGDVGIGTLTPTAKLDIAGKQHIAFDAPFYSASTDAALSIDGNPTTSSLPGVILYSSGGASANGVGLFGVTYATGVNVGDGVGQAFAPVGASAFNVSSDIRMKHDVSNIGESAYSKYMNDIRNIQSATFKYNFESEAQRSIPHIGVIAQSLPAEVQAHMNESPSKKGEERLGVSLADMSGLLLVGVKALDSRQSQLEKEISDLKAEIQQLKNNK